MRYLNCLSCGGTSAWAQCAVCYEDLIVMLNPLGILIDVEPYDGKYRIVRDEE